jgi:transketolase
MKNLRNKIIETVYNAKEGHMASALSILDIIYVIYDRVLNITHSNTTCPDRDRFILSKGHGSLALYAVLESKGFFDKDEMLNYCKFNSKLGGHPYPSLPGIEAATGSLGHGFPFGVGIALGCKRKNRKNKIVVLIGDQECNEGTIWESALLAANYKLDNLILIVDNNNSSNRSLPMIDLHAKFMSFGFDVVAIDGHDPHLNYNAKIYRWLY